VLVRDGDCDPNDCSQGFIQRASVPRMGRCQKSPVPVQSPPAQSAWRSGYGVTVGVLLVCRLGTLNILIFPIIRIAQSLENMTDLSHAAVRRLANSFVTLTLLEHLGNFNSAGLHNLHSSGRLRKNNCPSPRGNDDPVRISFDTLSF
jgi:hypothetical protein